MVQRIVCVASTFPTSLKYWRGTFVENFCEALSRANCDVSVVVPDGFHNIWLERAAFLTGRRKRRQYRFSVSYAAFFSISRLAFRSALLGRINRSLQEKAIYRALSRLKPRPDIVYAHFLGNGLSAHRWCVENGVPLVIVSGESSYEHFYRRLGETNVGKVVAGLKHLMFVSEKNQTAYTHHFGAPKCETSILPNAVDTRRFRPQDRGSLRQKLNLPLNARIVGFLGYFIERKGPLRVLQAIEGEEDIFGVFIGTGAQRPSGERVLFAGTMENSSVPDWLAACDAFVLPSLNEGRSNAIIEALACGLPVVVSDRPFNREFLTEDCAVFVDPENPADIARGILEVLCSEEKRSEMGKAARRLAEEFSLDARARRFLSLISGLREVKPDINV